MTEIRFRSTRDAKPAAGFGEALAQGLAPDGGLYVPVEWPRFAAGSWGPWGSLADTGAHLLAPFVAGDPRSPSLSAITAEAFDFPAPVVPLGAGGRLAVLELFHGLTAAEAYARLPRGRRESGRWVLVSTAHPAKFREIVEPLIGRGVPVPESLARLFSRPSACTEIEADLGSLRDALREDGIA